MEMLKLCDIWVKLVGAKGVCLQKQHFKTRVLVNGSFDRGKISVINQWAFYLENESFERKIIYNFRPFWTFKFTIFSKQRNRYFK
jgi:hypothetical protein